MVNGANSLTARSAHMLRGAIAFPITPFDAHGAVDLAGVRANLAMLADSGCVSIVAPSGTGELFSLTPSECAAITRATVEAVAGRKPVIAAVGVGPAIGAELARAAEDAGADAVLILPPYYQNPDPAGLLAYYLAIAGATRLPVLPYARDAAHFTPELVEQLALAAPNVVGYKDGRGDVRSFMRIREHVIERLGAERLVWLGGVGDDLLIPYAAAGAEGFTSSMACFWPEIAAELWDAVQHDPARSRDLHATVIRPFYELRARKRGYEVSVMKAAAEILGYAAGPPRAPLVPVTAAEHAEIAELLARLRVPTAASRNATAR
ncbi:MAG: dihydrodipicolinate synthase family protein [Candidatus Eremiobacteraeota bacterium]|nr:dihydrodipicolinate synthase family protein [Candidatus Eremiobacteraeota bacterium]